jgi:hypothetical protein
VETKIFFSAIIRGEEGIEATHCSVTVITLLYFGVIAYRFRPVEKVIASKIYSPGHTGPVITTYSYRSGNILAIIASKSYCSGS